MSEVVVMVTREMWNALQDHLFQGTIEQGAFLMTRSTLQASALIIEAIDCHLIPPDGWAAQLEVYLEMTDEERARIMKKARAGGYGVIDVHSHPGSERNVSFSPSDIKGISEFAAYSKWKLPGQPFAAMVCGESSFDAVVWHGDFDAPVPLSRLEICSTGTIVERSTPTRSWFASTRRKYGQTRSVRRGTHVK